MCMHGGIANKLGTRCMQCIMQSGYSFLHLEYDGGDHEIWALCCSFRTGIFLQDQGPPLVFHLFFNRKIEFRYEPSGITVPHTTFMQVDVNWATWYLLVPGTIEQFRYYIPGTRYEYCSVATIHTPSGAGGAHGGARGRATLCACQ